MAGSSFRLSNTMVSGRSRRSIETSSCANASRSSSDGVHTVPPALPHTPSELSAETTSDSALMLDCVMVRLAGSLPRPVKSVSWSSNSRAPSLDFAVLPWMVIWVTGSGMMMVWSSSVMMSAASRPSSVSPRPIGHGEPRRVVDADACGRAERHVVESARVMVGVFIPYRPHSGVCVEAVEQSELRWVVVGPVGCHGCGGVEAVGVGLWRVRFPGSSVELRQSFGHGADPMQARVACIG